MQQGMQQQNPAQSEALPHHPAKQQPKLVPRNILPKPHCIAGENAALKLEYNLHSGAYLMLIQPQFVSQPETLQPELHCSSCEDAINLLRKVLPKALDPTHPATTANSQQDKQRSLNPSAIPATKSQPKSSETAAHSDMNSAATNRVATKLPPGEHISPMNPTSMQQSSARRS